MKQKTKSNWSWVRVSEIFTHDEIIHRVLLALPKKIFFCEESGCWIWTKTTDRGGYSRLYACDPVTKLETCITGVHRWVYRAYKGEFDNDLIIRHSCDNPSCVNPDHLLLGTMDDNNKDKVERGRTCKTYGHLSDSDSKLITEKLLSGNYSCYQLSKEFDVYIQNVTWRRKKLESELGYSLKQKTFKLPL